MAPSIDWQSLGFQYLPTNAHVKSEFKNGSWSDIEVCTGTSLQLHIGATCLHYGQACFEGLKAFRQKDGAIAMFRPDANAHRLASSAQRLVMAPPPVELFIEACKKAINQNIEFVPPYGTGASLYIRPLLIGTSPRVGLRPAEEYALIVLVTPVGPYYKNGFFPVKAYVQEEYDRAAPKGVGNVKAAGNYAAGLYSDLLTKKKGYPIALYSDSAQHRFIDEFGTSNFFGITADNKYVTPDSKSILPSITNDSLQQLSRDFGMAVERRKIPMEELSMFTEVGACGTAAVITPIHSVTYNETIYTYGKENEAGPTLTRLYKEIQGIQYGEKEDRHNWMLAA
ncbi:MAG: branched-chain amino acid aminotransferase [Chitinivibrionales bacterium]|nr:branched-chain amino acid aminotransferase [Chitinivibrionales bacterium]